MNEKNQEILLRQVLADTGARPEKLETMADLQKHLSAWLDGQLQLRNLGRAEAICVLGNLIALQLSRHRHGKADAICKHIPLLATLYGGAGGQAPRIVKG